MRIDKSSGVAEVVFSPTELHVLSAANNILGAADLALSEYQQGSQDMRMASSVLDAIVDQQIDRADAELKKEAADAECN